MKNFNIYIWKFNLSINNDIIYLIKLLNINEKNRLANIKNVYLKNKYINRHAIIRIILSYYCKILPEKIDYIYNKNGKPYIKTNSHIYFNISHSENICVLAISSIEIGIDIQVQKNQNFSKISHRFFTKKENEYLAINKDIMSFFYIWIRKEAIIKLLGQNLIQEIKNINVIQDDNRIITSSSPTYISEIPIKEKNMNIYCAIATFHPIKNWYLLNFQLI